MAAPKKPSTPEEPENLRARVRRRKKKPPAVPPPGGTREERVLRRLADAMEEPEPPPGGLTPAQRAGYKGAANGVLAGLRAGAFRRRWKRDRVLLRTVQEALGRWFEGFQDAIPEDKP